jgi:rhodanese-related sulfurtransferase
MKRSIVLLALLPLLLFAEVRDLNIAGFEKLKSHGIPVIDIRTPQEWKETGVIEGSHPITFFRADGSYDLRDFLHRLKKLGIDRKDKPFILVCRSASRTRTLGNFLNEKLGYENVYHLTGGILNWRAHGKPLVPYTPGDR